MKYSIIISHYNRPDLIMNAIKSFSNLNDYEIIIIDDVSTKENIEKLQKNLKELNNSSINLYLSEKKCYLPGARNKGIELAKGKWIFFIDDDDQATKGFIKWLNKDKQKDKYDFYRFPWLINKSRTLNKNKRFFFKNYLYGIQISSFLIKKDYLIKNKINFLQFLMYEDQIFVAMIHKPKHKYSYINIPSIIFNPHDEKKSLTRSKVIANAYWLNIIQFYKENNIYPKCMLIILLYAIETRILRGDFIDEKEAKKTLIQNYEEIDFKFKDIWQLDWFRLFYWPKFKSNIKKWKKET